MRTNRVIVLLAGLLVLSAAYAQQNPAPAEGTLPPAEDLAKRVNEREMGQSGKQTIHMKLIEKDGSTRERVTRGFGKSYGEDKRFLLFFLEPSNIKGTALLTYDYGDPDKTDDQWLYLPAMRKTRRISGGERGGSFLGTDFTFEDIKDQSRASLRERTWTTVGQETVDDHKCYVVEAVPKTPDLAKELGYSKLRAYIDPELPALRRSEFWDASGTLFKTISMRDYQQVKGVWTACTLEAKNLKTGHSTVFTVTDVDHNMDLPDDLFTVQALERGLPRLP